MSFFKKIFILLCLLVSPCMAAEQENSPYIVEDVAVSVVAKSPAEARNLAVKTARRDAFMVLLARLSIDGKIANKVNDSEVLEMVRSEQIFDEKISGTTYAATFSVSFAKDFVDHILSQKNQRSLQPAKLEDEEKFVAIIIPVKILQRKTLLWEAVNDWRSAIRVALAGNDNFAIPVADSENITIVNAENINRVEISELEPLFRKYRGELIHFLLFAYDNINNKVSVTVRSVDRLHKSQVRLNFTNAEELDEQELMKAVASKVAEYLVGLKNGEKTLESEHILAVEIPINKLSDWLMIKGQIEGNGLVSKMNIESISADYVKATLTVTDQAGVDVIDAFAKIGFELKQKNSNLYSLTVK